jgi:hypothetical protein
MKLLYLLMLLFSTSKTQYANAAFSNSKAICKLDGRILSFKKVNPPSSGPIGSNAITRGEVEIDNEARLFASYNPFYGIGGNVSLILKHQTISLVTWDSDHVEDISFAKIKYKSRMIECRLH